MDIMMRVDAANEDDDDDDGGSGLVEFFFWCLISNFFSISISIASVYSSEYSVPCHPMSFKVIIQVIEWYFGFLGIGLNSVGGAVALVIGHDVPEVQVECYQNIPDNDSEDQEDKGDPTNDLNLDDAVEVDEDSGGGSDGEEDYNAHSDPEMVLFFWNDFIIYATYIMMHIKCKKYHKITKIYLSFNHFWSRVILSTVSCSLCM